MIENKVVKQCSLVVVTDQYAGNIERQLSGYIFGSCDEHGEHLASPAIEAWNRDVSDEDKDVLLDIVSFRPHDEYGLMPYSLFAFEGKYHAVEFYLDNYLLTTDDWRDPFFEYLKRRLPETVELPQPDFMGTKSVTVEIKHVFFKIDTTTSEFNSIR